MNKINKKILIVEDEVIIQKTLEEKLLSEGFYVIKANDGLEGFELAIKEHPDLILLDLLMPKIDGLSMLKKLREDPWGLKAKVIVLSNLSDPRKLTDDINIGLEGISEYMLKTNWSLDDVIIEIKKKLEIKS